MNNEIGSIMAFFHRVFPVKIYTKDVPVNFIVPSMYFPQPLTQYSSDTVTTFSKNYNVSVKLFHEDTIKANNVAELIADRLNAERNLIASIDDKGSNTGDYVRIRRIEVRIADEGVATIIVNWDSRYKYDREDVASLEYVDFEGEVKK